LVFLDPPYGDSVPYLEFSAMWNAFLGAQPDLRLDLSVSQRIQSPTTWETYAESLRHVVSAARRAIRPDGKVLVTFNSLDLRAWSALLDALQRSQFTLKAIVYQIPAVVSTKAQFSPNGSYVGDFYATYQPGECQVVDARIARPGVTEALRNCATEYVGPIPRTVVLRAGVLAWMRANAAATQYHLLDEWISELFESKKDHLLWQGSLNAQNNESSGFTAGHVKQLPPGYRETLT